MINYPWSIGIDIQPKMDWLPEFEKDTISNLKIYRIDWLFISLTLILHK